MHTGTYIHVLTEPEKQTCFAVHFQIIFPPGYKALICAASALKLQK